jgi:hypothetical protein
MLKICLSWITGIFPAKKKTGNEYEYWLFFSSILFVYFSYTVRSESTCALRLRYVDLVVSMEVAVSTLVDITSNTFYKCTATFRTHCILLFVLPIRIIGKDAFCPN